MTDRALSLDQDPASDRLSPEAVVEIHRDHRGGQPWDSIAQLHGISRKQVQRIVQGRRWASLHPSRAPHLYDDAYVMEVPPEYPADQVAQAWEAAREAFFKALG